MIRRSVFRFWPYAAVAACAWLLIGRQEAPSPTEELRAGPLVLERVQSLGDLHTARYHYQNVFEYRTHRQPAEWARTIGLGGLVENATRNKALASLTGSVEAGVDMTKARLVSEQPLVIELPEATIYPANLDMKLHESWPGAFWDDRNIGLKAMSAMKRRLQDGARRQGILQEAQTNAVEKVKALLQTVGLPEAEVRVASASSRPTS